MPIYEFYCKKCNTVYKFFSRSVNADKVPTCPHCRSLRLKRVVSLFTPLSGRKEDVPVDSDMPELDPAKLEKAMSLLASETGNVNEEDPRHAARLMKQLTDAAGLALGPGMEEAVRRMERGEDPEKIEEEMGDLLEGEEPFIPCGKRRWGSTKAAPRVDETLYDL